MDHEAWYEKALLSIGGLKYGTSFEVKDLFKGADWEGLSKGDRISFGRYFSNKVKEGTIECVSKIGEGKTHHNRYIKTDL